MKSRREAECTAELDHLVNSLAWAACSCPSTRKLARRGHVSDCKFPSVLYAGREVMLLRTTERAMKADEAWRRVAMEGA